jgi:Uma2 family endonuclease
MISKPPRVLPSIDYEKEAQAYLRSLPPEHFMEATAQATQREITLESLALVKARRSDVHVFNELLVQYERHGQRKPGQVVPDNMVVVTEEPIAASSSYNVPLEPAGPFWVLEYVSQSNKRKDYEESHRKYERELKVPYYLVFHPDEQDLRLYRHNRRRYVKVKLNEHGRYAIPELDLEIGLLDGWVRYWYQGELLPLPADMQQQLDAARRQVVDAKREAEQAMRQAAEATNRAEDLQRQLEAAEQELARLRARR